MLIFYFILVPILLDSSRSFTTILYIISLQLSILLNSMSLFYFILVALLLDSM